MYAMPLSKKFSAAIGGYIKNTSWAHDSFRSAGLSAILNYQANDRLNVYAYGQKSLLNSRHIPLPLYYMDDVADRIGIGAEYKVTPAFSIGLSVDYSADTRIQIRGLTTIMRILSNKIGNFLDK